MLREGVAVKPQGRLQPPNEVLEGPEWPDRYLLDVFLSVAVAAPSLPSAVDIALSCCIASIACISFQA